MEERSSYLEWAPPSSSPFREVKMSAEMHVWVGDEDPFELPLGGVTLFIHQGAPTAPRNSLSRPAPNTGEAPDSGAGQGSGGSAVTLANPTRGGGVYTNLIRDVQMSDRIERVLGGNAGSEIGIELPDLNLGTTRDREKVFEPIFDGLRSTSYGDIKVHLIRSSDLPPVDD
jgi:hypothetical protein